MHDDVTKPDLELFAKLIFEASGWPDGGDIDLGDFQNIAEECGLLSRELRYNACGENCACKNFYENDEFSQGVICYRKHEFVL